LLRSEQHGVVTALFHAPAGVRPYLIATGPDNNLWYTDDGGSMAAGSMTPSGTFNQYATPAAN